MTLLALAGCTEPPATPLDAGSLEAVTPGYAFVSEASAVFADNPAQGLSARFDGGRVAFTALDQGLPWGLELETLAIGCEGDALRPVADATPRAAGDRVELDRGRGLVEWYVNAPHGIEQGFSLSEAEGCSSRGSRLVLELRAEGLRGELVAGDVLFRDARGAAILGYAGQHVEDADGAVIPAQLSVHGDRVRINIDDSMARYPLVIDPLVTNEQARLLATGGAATDRFGASVAVSGDTMVIGAPGFGGAAAPGAAYVFVRSMSGAWSQQQRLVVAGTTAFGAAVAIDGDTVVIGAPFSSSFVGAAYVFVRAATTWSLEATLPAPGTPTVFGTGVAIAGDTALVGAEGSGPQTGVVRMFTRSGTVWSPGDSLYPSTSNPGMKFGASVAFDGTTIVVGAPFATAGGTRTGLAYTFRQNCFTFFEQEAILAPSDGMANGFFGNSVAVSSSTVLVGAPDHTFANNRGAAYVYTGGAPMGVPMCTPGVWTPAAQLTASDAADNQHFGDSVALAGDRAIVGARGTAGAPTGSGYYFTRAAGVWTEASTLVAADPLVPDLGTAAGIGATFGVLGAESAPGMGTANTGAVFVFDTSRSPNGASCGAGATCASGFCVDGFCCDSACGGGSTTDCQACSVAAGAAVDGACAARATGSCDDANSCTTGDTCGAGGACGGAPVVCTAPTACQMAACVPATGMCVVAPMADGSACDDGLGCTVADTRMAGVCTAGSPRVCTASDACHLGGTCDPATGACTNPEAPDGTACDDDSACTAADSCAAGVCVGSSPVVCMAVDSCHEAGACAPETGACSSPALPDGTACDDGGMCRAGACVVTDGGVTDASTPDGGVADSAVADSAVADSAVADSALPDTSIDAGVAPADDGGCGCRVAAPRTGASWPGALGVVGLLWIARRRWGRRVG